MSLRNAFLVVGEAHVPAVGVAMQVVAEHGFGLEMILGRLLAALLEWQLSCWQTHRGQLEERTKSQFQLPVILVVAYAAFVSRAPSVARLVQAADERSAVTHKMAEDALKTSTRYIFAR
jgi:hypothetical protein